MPPESTSARPRPRRSCSSENEEIVGRALTDTGANVVSAAESSFAQALEDAGLLEEEIELVIGTGYGRYRVTFGHDQVTEISCHARGALHMFPGTRTVLDMGGQDTKAIRVGAHGEVDDFCMNDKCAAGTGRFLGAASSALDIPLGELGPTALEATRPVRISTTCTVFAESEILSWLGKGKKVEDILLGVHQSIASRSIGLLRRVGIEPEITFTGGVAKNIGMIGRSRSDSSDRSTSAMTPTTWALWARRSSGSTRSVRPGAAHVEQEVAG